MDSIDQKKYLTRQKKGIKWKTPRCDTNNIKNLNAWNNL